MAKSLLPVASDRCYNAASNRALRSIDQLLENPCLVTTHEDQQACKPPYRACDPHNRSTNMVMSPKLGSSSMQSSLEFIVTKNDRNMRRIAALFLVLMANRCLNKRANQSVGNPSRNLRQSAG